MLYPRRHHHGTRLGKRLRPRRDVRHISENLAARIEHRRAGVDGDPCGHCGLSCAFVLAVHLGKRTLDREGGAHRPFGIVLLGDRVAEQRHQPVAELLGDLAAHLCHGSRCRFEIRAD